MTYKFLTLVMCASCIISLGCSENKSTAKAKAAIQLATQKQTVEEEADSSFFGNPIDTLDYDKRNLDLANGDSSGYWPVKKQPYPLPGAILPFKRIIAYYGNLYSVRMGALGEYKPKECLPG